MKNLVLHQQQVIEIDCLKGALNDADSNILCTIDAYTDDLYVIYNNEIHVICCFDELGVAKLSVKDIDLTDAVALQYAITVQELFCAFASGKIVSIDLNSPEPCRHSLVCQLTEGLETMQLSPDNEIVAAVTDTGHVLIMYSDFNVAQKVFLYSSEYGSEKLVSVGWGSKKTQFHGKAGKAAATAEKQKTKVNELDSGRSLISWQGEGQFFVVSYLNPRDKIRYFKTFDRNCTLLNTNEDNGITLSDSIAWNPLENLIAVSIKDDDKDCVVLYEKNGLKYSNFIFPFKGKQLEILNLFWSPEGDILAVMSKHSTYGITMVQLWNERNAHVYLKQTIYFPKENPLLYVTWTTQATNRANKNTLILLSLKEIRICSFSWSVDKSRGKGKEDLGVVCVIDGNTVLVTAFGKAIIPPPMCHCKLEFDVPVNAVIFGPDINDPTSDINCNTFCVVMCTNSFAICKRKLDAPQIEYEIFKTYTTFTDTCTLKVVPYSYNMHHFLWLKKDIILFSAYKRSFHSGFVGALQLQNIDIKGNDCIDMQKLLVAGKVIQHIIPSVNDHEAYIISNESVYKYVSDEFIPNMIESTDIYLNDMCRDAMVASYDSENYIIALTYTNRLVINGSVFTDGVISFTVHNEFLIYVSTRHMIVCVILENVMKDLQAVDCNDSTSIEKLSTEREAAGIARAIEREAQIIITLPYESKIVFQLPRGNLECIQPRSLLIGVVIRHLNNLEYAEAYQYMRKHRMNFNLMYDHNPVLFTDNAIKFVDDLGDPGSLSLFLSALQEDDVTRTTYSSFYQNRMNESVVTVDSTENITKVSNICHLLREIMEERPNADTLVQPILVSLLKCQKDRGLSLALIRIKELVMAEKEGKGNPHMSSAKALKYLISSVNISVLYDTALEMYDLELALFIASQSQKDPKEYIPFLNSLKDMDEHYRKYTIDMHLKRYMSALVHIAKDSSHFDKCVNLVCKFELYQPAMRLFSRNSVEFKKIVEVYGDFLMTEEIYHRAGMMYLRGGVLNKAAEAFTLAGKWQDALIMLKQMNLSSAELNAHCKTLVAQLKAKEKHLTAAEILLHYMKDAEEAIAMLCEGKCWKHAMRIAYDVNRLDLIETHVKPGLKEHAEMLKTHVTKLMEEFVKYETRLALLRSRMSARGNLMFSELYTFNRLITENIVRNAVSSDTNSVATEDTYTSTKSGRSHRTSKHRRKQERKLLSMKEGSMFEDYGLINALYHLVADAYTSRDNWLHLLETLVHLDFVEYAEELQNSINDFFRLVNEYKSDIWDNNAPSSVTELKTKGNYTAEQLKDMFAPLKIVARFIIFPPEAPDELFLVVV